MQALKEICSKYSKWKTLEEYINRIETYKDIDGVVVLENCKALIECICKTILDDLGESYSSSEKIHGLMTRTCSKINCLPIAGDLARSFVTVALRLGEFRNDFSEIGHGQSIYKLEENKRMVIGATVTFMVGTVDHLAAFLISIYQDEYPQHIQSQIRYEDNPEFNTYFDENYDAIEISQYGPYSPSELLFDIDKSAYKTELVNYNQTKDEPHI